MKFPSYTTRKDGQASMEHWTLYPDHISISSRLGDDPETVEKLKFTQIKLVELHWNPKTKLYSCEMYLNDGRKVEFSNRTWTEEKKPILTDNEYVLFVPNLLKALGRESLECRFISGVEPFRYFKKLFFMSVFAGFWLGLVGFFGVAGVFWMSLAMLVLILSLLPRTLRWFRMHRPDEFSPSHIPSRLLPKFIRRNA